MQSGGAHVRTCKMRMLLRTLKTLLDHLGLGPHLLGSSARYPAMCADTIRYRRSVMMISNDRRIPSSADPRGRTELVDCKRRTASGREFQSVMVRRKMNVWKHQYELANINLFSLKALVRHDETERWSREMAERLLNAL